MGFVPANAEWFFADLVVEHRIEGDSRNVVHVNPVLVRADSAKEAYAKAMQLGEGEEMTYENTEGKTVTVSFRGLHELSVIHDPLEHGSELWYSEKIGLTEEDVLDLVQHDSLSVFTESEPNEGPNYMPKDIMEQVIKALGECQMNDGIQRQGDCL